MKNSGLSPLLSAGIGLAKVKINDFVVPGSGLSNWSNDDMVFAYQAGAGIGYDLSKSLTISAKYRYFGTADLEFDTTDADFSSHNIMLGVALSFYRLPS